MGLFERTPVPGAPYLLACVLSLWAFLHCYELPPEPEQVNAPSSSLSPFFLPSFTCPFPLLPPLPFPCTISKVLISNRVFFRLSLYSSLVSILSSYHVCFLSSFCTVNKTCSYCLIPAFVSSPFSFHLLRGKCHYITF